ncbi:MAG TPA: restriction endonuclease [bacterium]|nr:restriction endonuclease [bacterium]
MLSATLKERLLKVPGAAWAVGHLSAQGHTEQEAEFGGLLMAGLVVFLSILVINSLVLGMIRGFFFDFWVFIGENPMVAVAIGLFVTALILAILLKSGEDRKKAAAREAVLARQRQALLISRRESIDRGGWAHFEEVFRAALGEKYPEIDVKMVYAVDAVPRIKFAARMFRGAAPGGVQANFQRFREALLKDTLHVIQTAFGLSESVSTVTVDAIMSFVDLKARFYDGAVLSVKARRDVFRQLTFTDSSLFKDLSAFEIRYNDGMEVEPFPEEQGKQAQLLQKLRAQAPKLEVRYAPPKEEAAAAREEGWEPLATPAPLDADWEGRALSSLPLAEFQELAQGLLGRMGFVGAKAKKVPGGTLQILAEFPDPVLGGQYMILARQYPENAAVHADLVRELDELARQEGYRRGIYLVTGVFTEEARNISRKIAVDLVDGQRLAALLRAPAYQAPDTRMLGAASGGGDLSRMTLDDFEVETLNLLGGLGFKLLRTRRTGAGAIVAVAEHPHPIVGGKVAVMAKQYPAAAQIPDGLINEFSFIMSSEFCHRGLLLAPALFSPEARDLARVSGVDLVDRGVWENLRGRHPGAG